MENLNNFLSTVKILAISTSLNDIIAITGAATTISITIIGYLKNKRETAIHKLELEAMTLKNERLKHENRNNITGYRIAKIITSNGDNNNSPTNNNNGKK